MMKDSTVLLLYLSLFFFKVALDKVDEFIKGIVNQFIFWEIQFRISWNYDAINISMKECCGKIVCYKFLCIEVKGVIGLW